MARCPRSPRAGRHLRIIEILVEKIQADTVKRWGVQQSELTIIYRFSQPNEPAALVLPMSVRISSRNRLPETLETIGDHLLRRRLSLKLLQRQVAAQLGTNVASLRNWEANRTEPEVKLLPAIIRFLGYNPLPPGRTWAERLVNTRMALGLSQQAAAKQMAVDQSTLARWERGERVPENGFAKRAQQFLALAESGAQPKSRIA